MSGSASGSTEVIASSGGEIDGHGVSPSVDVDVVPVVDLRDGVEHEVMQVPAPSSRAAVARRSGGLGWPESGVGPAPRRPVEAVHAPMAAPAPASAQPASASVSASVSASAPVAAAEPEQVAAVVLEPAPSQPVAAPAAVPAPVTAPAVATGPSVAADGDGPVSPPMSPELFATLVKSLPKGYALIPVGYELRTAPSVKPVAKNGTARPATRPGTRTPSKPGARPSPWALPDRAVLTGSAITVIAMMLLVLASNALLLGHVKHVRDQQVALDDLRADLANGTAPVNQTDDDNKPIPTGKPLGILEIPALGLREVYLQGTISSVMMSGVAHRRDTVMPGQVGTSVLYGRKTAFGGPFSLLDQLPLGSVVLVTNGLGEKLPFKVVGIRRGGDPLPAAPASGARVTLVTATGGPYQPDGTVRLDADFVPGAGVNGQQLRVTAARSLTPGLTAAERPLAGDPSGWAGIVGGLLLLFPLTLGVAYARTRWGRWQAWLAGLPPLFAAGIYLTNSVIQLLPNLM